MKFMKAPITKPTETSQAPVFPKTLHRVRQRPKDGDPTPKSAKRDNVFSQSRDVREDRGTRQIKTKHNSQTLFRKCGNSKP
jgi:hypothetical protein